MLASDSNDINVNEISSSSTSRPVSRVPILVRKLAKIPIYKTTTTTSPKDVVTMDKNSETDLWSNRLVAGVCEFEQSSSEGSKLLEITKNQAWISFYEYGQRGNKYSCSSKSVLL